MVEESFTLRAKREALAVLVLVLVQAKLQCCRVQVVFEALKFFNEKFH